MLENEHLGGWRVAIAGGWGWRGGEDGGGEVRLAARGGLDGDGLDPSVGGGRQLMRSRSGQVCWPISHNHRLGGAGGGHRKEVIAIAARSNYFTDVRTLTKVMVNKLLAL